jgi:hypothetical protein
VHNEGLKAAHLGMEKANGAALRVVRAERVRTNQLGQLRGLVDRGRASGAHFVQDGGNTSACQLPSGFAAGKATPDDVNRAHSLCHFGKLGRSPLDDNLAGINHGRRRYTRIRTIRRNPVLVISVVSAEELLHARCSQVRSTPADLGGGV